MARPKDFDTLAKAITKMSGNPMVRDELNSVYAKDLQSVPRLMTHSAASSGSTGTDSGPITPRPLNTRRVPIIQYDGSESGYHTPTPPSGSRPHDASPRRARKSLSDLNDRELDEVASDFTLSTPHFTPTAPAEPLFLVNSDPYTPQRDPNRFTGRKMINFGPGYTRERRVMEEMGYEFDPFPSYSQSPEKGYSSEEV